MSWYNKGKKKLYGLCEEEGGKTVLRIYLLAEYTYTHQKNSHEHTLLVNLAIERKIKQNNTYFNRIKQASGQLTHSCAQGKMKACEDVFDGLCIFFLQ